VAPLRPHDLRHTAVALWIATDANPLRFPGAPVTPRSASRSTVTDTYFQKAMERWQTTSMRSSLLGIVPLTLYAAHSSSGGHWIVKPPITHAHPRSYVLSTVLPEMPLGKSVLSVVVMQTANPLGNFADTGDQIVKDVP
jgi:hypothetical protein